MEFSQIIVLTYYVSHIHKDILHETNYSTKKEYLKSYIRNVLLSKRHTQKSKFTEKLEGKISTMTKAYSLRYCQCYITARLLRYKKIPPKIHNILCIIYIYILQIRIIKLLEKEDDSLYALRIFLKTFHLIITERRLFVVLLNYDS